MAKKTVADVDVAGKRVLMRVDFNVPLEGGADALPVVGDWNGRDLVTLDELRQIYGTIPDEPKVVEGLPALNAAMAQAGISTPGRKAAFLATLRSESGFRFDAVEAGNDDARATVRGEITPFRHADPVGTHRVVVAADDHAVAGA